MWEMASRLTIDNVRQGEVDREREVYGHFPNRWRQAAKHCPFI